MRSTRRKIGRFNFANYLIIGMIFFAMAVIYDSKSNAVSQDPYPLKESFNHLPEGMAIVKMHKILDGTLIYKILALKF